MADESDVGHASSDCTWVPQVETIHCFIVRRMTTTPQRSEQHVADIHWAPSSDSSVKILKQNLNTTTARTDKKKKKELFPLFDWHPPPSMGTDSKFCWFRAVKGKWTPRGRFIFRSGPAKIFKFAEWVPIVLPLYLFHVPFGIITRDWWFDSIPWPLDILCMWKFRCGPHTFVSLFTFSAQNFHYYVGFLSACLPKNKGIFWQMLSYNYWRAVVWIFIMYYRCIFS